jgi:hypothetical protein
MIGGSGLKNRLVGPITGLTMPIPGVHIETLHSPQAYTAKQLDLAAKVAGLLARGRLLLVESPLADA